MTTEAQATEAASSPPPAIVRGTLDGADCANCPFSVDGRALNPVFGVGPQNPTMILLGEGPGVQECRQKMPFVGPTGELLNRALQETGVDRSKAWVSNVTLCIPPPKSDVKVRKQAAQACKGRLERELMERPDIPVLALGDVAASTILEGATKLPITKIAGSHFDWDVDGSGPRSVIPTVHPAAILRSSGDGDKGPEKTGSHVADLAFWALKWDVLKVKALAEGKDIRLRMRVDEELFVELKDPERARNLVWDRICAARETGRITIDYETYVDDPQRNFALQAFVAKIRLLSLASAGKSCSVLWDLLDPVMIDEYAKILADETITKAWHNGQVYDSTVSQNQWYRFKIAGPVEDTLLGQHVAWPGAKKTLQHVACQYRAIEPWKCLRGDVKVLLPDRSTVEIREAVRRRIPAVLSFDGERIVSKRVLGWHDVHVPGQAWVRITTDRSDAKYSHGLIVTPDHKVMTDRGLIEAQQLRVGVDRVLVDEPRFSEDQIAAALGTLLGDSTLNPSRTYHKRPWEAKRLSLRGGHANEGLRDCKVAALALGTRGKRDPACTRRLKSGVRLNASAFYRYGTKWAFQYADLAPLVYDRDWKRRITPAALQRLGRRGLAMMYMDDGDLHKAKHAGCRRSAGFATNGFPLEDVQLFAAWLRDRYGAVTVQQRVRGGAYCALSVVATANMLEDLRGYIHPAVGYKTIFDDAYIDVQSGVGAYSVAVTAVAPVVVTRDTPDKRYLNDHRYCLTVEDTKLFYTNYGLVSNSEYRDAGDSLEDEAVYSAKDALTTDASIAPTLFWIKKHRVEKVYEVDKIKGAVASMMHLRGYFVDPDVNTEIKRRLKTVIDEANAFMGGRYEEIKERVWEKLAAERAKTQRKRDPEHYADRIRVRKEELAKEIAKGDFEFSPSNDWHAAAFLKAAGVPLWATTKGGRTATGAAVLEKFSQYPEVDELLRLRSNEQLYDTFVVRMFEWTQDSQGKWRPPHVQDDGRAHPIWKPTQISGRYGSEDPASSNWSMGDETNADPRRRLPNMRRQLVAPMYRAIVAFDKAQLEARAIAVQSGDPFLCAIFRDGKDIHHEFGRIAFPAMDHLDKASEEYNHLRDTTKRVEYGAIYGGADATVHKAIAAEVPALAGPQGFKMVREAIATMKKAIPGVFAWQQKLLRETSQPPYTLRSFILGRRRVFPLGNPPPTDIANNPNQFFGADVMDLGLVEIMKRLEKYDEAFPILHQHDALYLECWEDDALRLAKDVDESFYIEIKGVSGDVIAFPNEIKIGFAYHSEPSDKQKAKFPQLVWDVGRPGLKKVKL